MPKEFLRRVCRFKVDIGSAVISILVATVSVCLIWIAIQVQLGKIKDYDVPKSTTLVTIYLFNGDVTKTFQVVGTIKLLEDGSLVCQTTEGRLKYKGKFTVSTCLTDVAPMAELLAKEPENGE